jgi:ParB-like chromosome segregation protein Spo0J
VYVHALVLDATPLKEAVLTGFIENFERMDLSPYEQAVCYKDLSESKGYSREELARRLGIQELTLDYMIAALSPDNLPIYMITSWKDRQLTMGHVIALYRLRRHKARQKELYQMIIARGMKVAETEFWCNQLLETPDLRLEHRQFIRLEEQLLELPDTRQYIDNRLLSFSHSRRGERLALSFKSVDELEQMLTRLKRSSWLACTFWTAPRASAVTSFC